MVIALLRDSSFGSFVKESARKKYQMQLGDSAGILVKDCDVPI